jgi:hypothetical protein
VAIEKKPMNSSVWNDLIKVRDLYVKRRVMLIGDGKKLITGTMPGVAMSLSERNFLNYSTYAMNNQLQ